MRELRKDYILNRWVIINTDRSKRPREYTQEKPKLKEGVCVFCPGNENLTPPEITRIEKNGKWTMRVVPNKFPAVTPDGDSAIKSMNSLFTYSHSFGRHEVIIETPNHTEQLADFDVGRIKVLLGLYTDRINELKKDKRIKQVAVFKNQGEAAGCSLSHAHTQIIAYNRLASTIDEEVQATSKYKKKHRRCPYCEVIKIESKSNRKIAENKSIVAIAPYASRFAFEVMLFPKHHRNSIVELSDDELLDLAKVIKKILLKLKKLNAPYNMYLHNAPQGEELHFHIKINPRILPWGGFEHLTGCIVNTVSPEDAAKYYRGK